MKIKTEQNKLISSKKTKQTPPKQVISFWKTNNFEFTKNNHFGISKV